MNKSTIKATIKSTADNVKPNALTIIEEISKHSSFSMDVVTEKMKSESESKAVYASTQGKILIYQICPNTLDRFKLDLQGMYIVVYGGSCQNISNDDSKELILEKLNCLIEKYSCNGCGKKGIPDRVSKYTDEKTLKNNRCKLSECKSCKSCWLCSDCFCDGLESGTDTLSEKTGLRLFKFNCNVCGNFFNCYDE
jgi:hypothetical protein